MIPEQRLLELLNRLHRETSDAGGLAIVECLINRVEDGSLSTPATGEVLAHSTEIDKAKLAVLENALGICALAEPELYERLEKIYWIGFKAGTEFQSRPHRERGVDAGMLEDAGG